MTNHEVTILGNSLAATACLEATFRYAVNEPGCHWLFDSREDWKLSDGTTLSAIGQRLVPLLPPLKKALNELDHGSTFGNYDFPTSLELLDWVVGERAPTCDDNPAVLNTAAIMLNHVVSSGTVKPFKTLSSFVGRHVTIEIQNLPIGSPCWIYLLFENELALLDEYLLTFPTWFFKVDQDGLPVEVLEQSKLAAGATLLKSHRILHEYSILTYERTTNDFIIRLRNQVTVAQYERGRRCNCIPIAGPIDDDKRKKEPVLVATPEMVVSSPAVADALEQLSRVWSDRFTKSVLISAPPGSGKENFATSIPFGQGRPSSNFAPVSLAGDRQSLSRQLYGKRREDGSIEAGLLATASNSAVFLDEVHQPRNQEESLRPSLLRPLESGEYFPVEGNVLERINNVVFILATSKRVNELWNIDPKDFWTRMSHVISIKHPLDLSLSKSGPSEADIIQDFFKFFWWERVRSFYKVEPDLLEQEPVDTGSLISIQQARAILEEEALNLAAKKFADALLDLVGQTYGKTVRHCSIRGIRSMTSRLFSLVANDIARGRDNAWIDRFEKYLRSVVEEILPMALLD